MSTHPAFPVIVSVWFAALLGIGSLVLPIELFERAVVATDLAASFEAAQPPLGPTARIVVAGLAAVIGALAGLFVSARIAAASKPRSSARPVPQVAPAELLDAKRPISAHEELGDGGFDGEDDLPAWHAQAGGQIDVAQEDRSSEYPSAPPMHEERLVEEPLDLVEFAAWEDETSAPEERELESAEDHAEVADSVEAAAPLSARPLGELGMVELVERFALALQRHRDAPLQPAPAEDEVTHFARRAEDCDREAPESVPMPAALRPVAFDDESDEDDLSALDLTKALSSGHPAYADADLTAEEDGDDGDDLAEGYTSLLAVKNPVGASREPVRLESVPTDATRIGAAPASGGSERALREALEKLQKLSGAA